MGILSDAGWLDEDVPALHDLTLRLLFLENASGFNNTLRLCDFEPWLSNRQGDVVSLHREREKKIRRIKF